MDSLTLVALVSIITAGFTVGVGVVGPSLAQGRAIGEAMKAMAQQPDESASLTRTLLVGLAMIESMAIYCLVVALILIFANPFWRHWLV